MEAYITFKCPPIVKDKLSAKAKKLGLALDEYCSIIVGNVLKKESKTTISSLNNLKDFLAKSIIQLDELNGSWATVSAEAEIKAYTLAKEATASMIFIEERERWFNEKINSVRIATSENNPPGFGISKEKFIPPIPIDADSKLVELLKKDIKFLGLNHRCYNSLARRADVKTIYDLVKLKPVGEFDRIRNFGNISQEQTMKILEKHGLYIGMDLDRIKHLI